MKQKEVTLASSIPRIIYSTNLIYSLCPEAPPPPPKKKKKKVSGNVGAYTSFKQNCLPFPHFQFFGAGQKKHQKLKPI